VRLEVELMAKIHYHTAEGATEWDQEEFTKLEIEKEPTIETKVLDCSLPKVGIPML
jgi:hypothetical protein